MAVKLSFRVLDGPQVDLVIEADGPKCSVGGVGSGADREILGLPHGFKYIEFEQKGDRWSVAEFKPRSTLINEKNLKARNVLREGDVIWLPSQVSGQSVRLKVALETIKKQSTSSGMSLKTMNPLILVGGAVYLVVFLGMAVYFSMSSEAPQENRQMQISDVRATITADIENANLEAASRKPTLSAVPGNFGELQSFLLSDIPEQRKLELSEAFRQLVETQFSDAWRLEQQNRWGEARAKYKRVIAIMGGHDLETTKLALRQLGRLRGL